MSFFKAREANEAPRSVPWSEKYRPKSLADIASQEAIVSTLDKTLQSSNIPHMLFYGPPGTGKTSTILALAKDLFGPELMKSRVLELNASDERGIQVVRDKVKNFARTVISNPSESDRKKYPCPPYKIIVLDEADSMTQDAQAALRRTMETYSKITRFCLICNYVTRIIDPLASRCSKFRFKPLNETNALSRLGHIAQSENVACENEKDLVHLLQVSSGDLRKAITLLQSSKSLAGPDGKVNETIIDEVSGTVPDDTINTFVDVMMRGTSSELEKSVTDIVLDGWSVAQVISQLHERLLLDDGIEDKVKNVVSLSLSEADRRLVDGSDEHITLLDVATTISSTFQS